MRFQAPESLSEQIAQHLGARIIRGDMEAGERVQELKVAGELNVSRGSVREALLILERRHLIKIVPRKGAVVSELSIHHVNSLYDVYIMLIMMLVKKLAETWQEQDLMALLNHINKNNRVVPDDDSAPEFVMNVGFDLMFLASDVVNNPYLREMLENLRPAVNRAAYFAIKRHQSEFKAIMAFYADMVRAAQARNVRAIETLVRQFGEHQRRLVLDELSSMSHAHNIT